jgi:hypothetical protein
VEGGLRETPLPKVEGLLAGEQPFTQQNTRSLKGAALDEISVPGDQHLPDVIRVAEQVHMQGTEPEVRHITVPAGDLLEEAKRIPAEGE